MAAGAALHPWPATTRMLGAQGRAPSESKAYVGAVLIGGTEAQSRASKAAIEVFAR